LCPTSIYQKETKTQARIGAGKADSEGLQIAEVLKGRPGRAARFVSFLFSEHFLNASGQARLLIFAAPKRSCDVIGTGVPD
jgi:hypothetical protein